MSASIDDALTEAAGVVLAEGAHGEQDQEDGECQLLCERLGGIIERTADAPGVPDLKTIDDQVGTSGRCGEQHDQLTQPVPEASTACDPAQHQNPHHEIVGRRSQDLDNAADDQSDNEAQNRTTESLAMEIWSVGHRGRSDPATG